MPLNRSTIEAVETEAHRILLRIEQYRTRCARDTDRWTANLDVSKTAEGAAVRRATFGTVPLSP
jgi:hypothetical protein